MGNYKAATVKAQKEKEATEGQFAVLESEKTTLNKALEEVKVARDEAIALANSLRFEQERLIRVAKKEVEERMAKVIFEKKGNYKGP